MNSGKRLKLTPISSTAVLGERSKISISDGVWIWHHTIIDGSNGVDIGEGAQIGAWVSLFSHGSHLTVRLLGQRYIEIPREDRLGYTRGAGSIGPYCFIGAGALIMPRVTLGKGCLVAAGAIVSKSAADFSILRGNPAEVDGDVRNFDR